MCQRFHCCALAGECFLKNKELNFQKKTVITLVFKLKALIIRDKSELAGYISIKFHVAYVKSYKKLDLCQEKCAPVN